MLILVGIVWLSSWSVFRYRAARNQVGLLQAEIHADGGIDDALNRLSHDPFWRADGSEFFPLLTREFMEGEGYAVGVDTQCPPDRRVITATGRANGFTAERRQEVLLLNPFLFVLMAEEDIEISGEARLDGHVSSRESVRLHGLASVTGVVQAGRDFSGPAARVEAGVYERLCSPLALSFEELGPAYLALRPRRLFGGQIANQIFSDTLVWISGTSDVTGLQVTKGVVIVSGDLHVRGPVTIEAAEGMAALVVSGNVRIENQGRLRVVGPVFVSGAFINAGRCDLVGTVIASRIETGSDFRIRPNLAFAYSGARGFPNKIVRGRYSIVR